MGLCRGQIWAYDGGVWTYSGHSCGSTPDRVAVYHNASTSQERDMAKWERPDIRAMPYRGGLYVGVLKNFRRKFQYPVSREKSLEVSNSRLTFVPDFSPTSTAKILDWN